MFLEWPEAYGEKRQLLITAKLKPDRNASLLWSPGRSLARLLARSSVAQPAEAAGVFRTSLLPQSSAPTSCHLLRRPRELSRSWEVGLWSIGRLYWMAGQGGRGEPAVIGGDTSRRGRGRYIRGVPVAAQAVGLLECGATVETRRVSRRPGKGVVGGSGSRKAQDKGLQGGSLSGPASPRPWLGLIGGKAASPRTPKRRRLRRQRRPQPCCAMWRGRTRCWWKWRWRRKPMARTASTRWGRGTRWRPGRSP